jgi:hypothetical protein
MRQGQSPAGGERGLEFGKLVRPSFTTTTSPSKIAVATGIERGRDRREALGPIQSNPIQSGPGVDSRPALVEVKLEPIAVVLDFVEPVVAGGRLGSQRGELGGMNPGIADGFEPVDRSREKPRLGTLRQLRKLAKFRPGPEDNGGQSTGYFPKAANGQTRT